MTTKRPADTSAPDAKRSKTPAGVFWSSFDGEVLHRPEGFAPHVAGPGHKNLTPYVVNAYQYATSSSPELCQPATLVIAKTEGDITKTLQYAKENSIGVAIRSSGHAFFASCGTTGANIQLNLREFKHMSYDEETKIVTAGCAVPMDKLNPFLEKIKDGEHTGAFIPHGQCGTVCVGGHLQTGGFSVLIGRSFGFFSDHVTSFKIITADCETMTITKPVASAPSPENDDIWWAVIGGSPGNFGVVVEVSMLPLWDYHYPESRALGLVTTFSPEALEAGLKLVAKYNDNDEWAADFNISCNVLARSQVAHGNIDTEMLKHQKEIYGPACEPHPTVIEISASWCNLDGKEYTQEAKDFFADIKKAMDPFWSTDKPIIAGALNIVKYFWGSTLPYSDSDKATPLSVLNSTYTYSARVEPNPYVAATWCGQRQNLSTNGFVDWARDTTVEVNNMAGVFTTVEWCVCGGKYSKHLTNGANNPTSLAFRDIKLLCFLYIHHSQSNLLGNKEWKEPGQQAQAWLDKVATKAVGPDGLVAEADRRWHAFAFGDYNLDRVHNCYYDNEDVYQRLKALKRRLDPEHVLTPNTFCVGAGSLPRFQGTPAAAEAKAETPLSSL